MKFDNVLVEAKRLYDLGFAILILHPKQKRPKGNAWTKGPRSSWDDVLKAYEVGDNIGVRTGAPSKIGENYLACIDVDVKDPKFKETAYDRLSELLGFEVFPSVSSGSGNGSAHFYCVTKSPFKMLTIEKHKDKWEICVYSNGRQMVLPPSIHPSGKPYKWNQSPKRYRDLPLMEFEVPELQTITEKVQGASKLKDESFTFTPRLVDLEWLEISETTLKDMITGVGVDDRSVFLLTATQALVSCGLTRDEVLSVLTDPRYFVSQCSESRRGKNRLSQAQWLWEYTVKKVMTEKDLSGVFSEVGSDFKEKRLSLDESKKQTEEILEDIPTSKDQGFYFRGEKGGRIPDYDGILKYFNDVKPFKTIADMKSIYTFCGTHYEYATPIELKGFAEENFNPKPSDKIRTEFYNKALANNIVSRAFFSKTTDGRINFNNGILDLNTKSKELLKHSPEYGFRSVLPYSYDPIAKCPQFKNWIWEIMEGDEALIAILQEFMGYIVRGGEYKYHKALFLDGTGRNGKSTFLDVLKALIGAGNYAAIPIKALVGDKFVGAGLDGVLANFSDETSSQELKESGPFKNLTGDGDMVAQKKYGDPFHFRNRAKLVISYNNIPDLSDLSVGMLSRPIIVPFKKFIKKGTEDKKIKEKLFSELPGIFNFALRGWDRLEAKNDFTYSEKSVLALARVEAESCNVTQWLENYMDINDSLEFEMKPHQLYTAYKASEKHAYGSSNFFRRLAKHPKLADRRTENKGGEGVKYWGIKPK